jgi:UDP-glucose 4-epimerase
MKVLVCGGAGFVGSFVVDALVEQGHEIIVVDNFLLGKMSNIQDAMEYGNVKVYNEDARQLTALHEIIATEKIDTVVNLAMKCLPTSFVDPEGAYMAGVQIADNLAYILRKNSYKHLVHFSSSEIYGSAIKVPMSEEHPKNPTTPYAAGKLAADNLLLSYHNVFGCKVSIIRPFNLVGPRQNWATFAALVPLTIRRILKGKKPIIYGDGFQTRDFTNVKDIAEIVPTLLDSDALVGKAVNIGQGKETTILEIMEIVCDEMGVSFGKVEFLPARAADVQRHCADITLAKNLLGYSPKTNLKETVHQTVEWYKNTDSNQGW